MRNKFEYHVVQLQKAPLGMISLKDLGEEGWELINVVSHLDFFYYYFKRPVEEKLIKSP